MVKYTPSPPTKPTSAPPKPRARALCDSASHSPSPTPYRPKGASHTALRWLESASPATSPKSPTLAPPRAGPSGAHSHTIRAAIRPLSAKTSAWVKISSGSGPIA
jgi:hypothetical protein